MDYLCYAEFFRHHYVFTISNENDWQPVEPTDDMLKTILAVTSHCLSVISFISSPEKLKMSESSFCLEIFYTK